MTVFRFPMFFTVVNRDEKVLKRNPKFAHFLRERDLTYKMRATVKEAQLIRFSPLPRAAEGGTPISCKFNGYMRRTGKGSLSGIQNEAMERGKGSKEG